MKADPRSPEVRALVARALARDPTQVEAIELHALDFALSGQPGKARTLFRLSDRLSRRSLPTRLWLIQDAVDRGDVAAALGNFDIALRTTTDAQPILFPVLARASADPSLTTPLARMLDRPSDWRLMFIEWTLANDSDLRPIARLIGQMRDQRFIRAQSIDQHLIEALVTQRDFADARLLNRKFGRAFAGVADADFRNPSAHYPFGWGLVSNGSLGAERAFSGSSASLTYRAAPANSGQVAAQLLTLQPGRYVLATRTGPPAIGEAPYWSISCGEAGGGEIARLDQPSGANGVARTAFTVPAGCTGQWLTLRIRPAADSTSQSGVILGISVSQP